MKTSIKAFAFLAMTLAKSTSVWADAKCGPIHQQTPVYQRVLDQHQNLVEVPLLPLREQEVAPFAKTDKMGVINSQIEAINQEILLDLKSLPIEREVDGRISTVDKDLAQKILSSVNRHPVVSSYEYSKYNRQPGVEIGFCFGRATYTHLMALHLGVNKDSIKKIWIVGPMNAGGLMWDFHVATLVRGENGEWLAVDSNHSNVQPVSDWYKYYTAMSTDGRLRVYITDANKFSVDLGKYDKVQLGLNLPRQQDWYSGYFKDMMTWFQQNKGNPDLKPLGLPTYREIRVQRGLSVDSTNI